MKFILTVLLISGFAPAIFADEVMVVTGKASHFFTHSHRDNILGLKIAEEKALEDGLNKIADQCGGDNFQIINNLVFKDHLVNTQIIMTVDIEFVCLGPISNR